MPYVEINGDDIFYASHDHDGSHNLVCIHGAGDDHSIWPSGLGTLPDCNTWMLDLPGHGRSSGVSHNGVDSYTDAVSHFVDTLGLDRVILAGHSLGGAVVLTQALRRPDWLVGLVLVCSGARLKIPPELRELVRSDYPSAVDHMTAIGFSPEASGHLRSEHKRRMLATDPSVFIADFDALDAFDISARLGDIPQQTLLISGDIDHMTPLKYSQFLEDRLPNARLAVIAPAGHQLPREQPEEMVRIIRNFLRDCS